MRCSVRQSAKRITIIKMSSKYVLGIDTSNYTTSAALYDLETGAVIHKRMLLPVSEGGRGLRQSDAVFHHTQQLHLVINQLVNEAGENPRIAAIGVSARPRDTEGSYMPCFTVGVNTAKSLASLLGVPVYEYSHQAGHIAAAVYSSGHTELYDKEFIAFHVSGGTTEAVLVKPSDDHVFDCTIVGKTLDLHAGQAIDRVGVAMGLKFPCGAELEKLAMKCGKKINVKVCVKDTDCCLSGIENICSKMAENNTDSSEIAMTCLVFIEKTLEKMCGNILDKYGDLPVLFAGGVMSDIIIREGIKKRFDCFFATPELSSDNACGAAVLAARRFGGN